MSQSPAVAPSSQAAAVKALSSALGVRVSTKKAEKLGDKYVIVQRIGGSSSTFATANPRFLVQCYAPTELEAERFAELVAATWRGLRTNGIIYAYDDHNIVPLSDPDTSHVRFQFTGGLTIQL